MTQQTRQVVFTWVAATVLAGALCARAGAESQLADPKLVSSSGMTIKEIPGAGLEFNKAGDERRLLAFAGRLDGSLDGAKTADVSFELKQTSGNPPRPVLVLYDAAGGAWFRVYAAGCGGVAQGNVRLSLNNWQRAVFSATDALAPTVDKITTVWVGFAFDGPATGTLRLVSTRFSDQPYVPAGPVRVTGDGAGQWNCNSDKDAKATVTTPSEGPGGKPCMKCEFEVPGGKHMFVTPTMPFANLDLEGMTTLRFKAIATIPAGMRVLICLSEQNGCSYFCEPPPPWPAPDWGDMTIPLNQFKPAGWGAKDDNGQLDVPNITGMTIGTHGTPTAAGKGLIQITDIEFTP
ncbi:MAG: hypothetical protein A3K19_32575 [Lentisphaerae bacterium RIFOXYB12_FULL_65_16]|nr:MAG: hypothetical protein A3K18_07990 [Lentisphaerae bacterium RIFOXYA12_64_32]OGV84433.1 MAG: hypothetical protein A3K19_32575 [Lentisphaerae bacterium RIFOXYB12_FULL_65_16]